MFNKNYLFFILILTTIIYLLIFVVNYDFKSKDIYLSTILTTNLNLTRKNLTLFCFVKTHPEHFNTRLIVSYENCIKYCTDYR